ncbi:glucosamine-6-phosphate deaminase [soil metagenome]
MQLAIYKNYQELSNHAANEIIDCIKNKPAPVICLASGDTPKLTCSLFVQRVLEEKIDLSQCMFIGLDEWVGIPPENQGSCHHFFHKYIFEPLHLPAAQFSLFDALSDDLNEECRKMDEVIAGKGGIDLMVVGVGINGHIGFNEPGVSINNYAHVIELEETTQSVGQKYFNGPVKIDKGITLGLQYLLETNKVIMLANGTKKAPVIKRAMEDEISTQFPATIMRMHTNSLLMVDEEAAALLKA